MKKEITCKICGGDLASNRHPALKMHQSLSTCIKSLQARAKAAEEKLSTIRYCARYDREVNKDAVDGKTLPQWISLLYLAYIGDYMNPDVLEQIERGSLFFPNAPIYAERDAAVARAEAAENRLAELEAAARWRPVIEKPVDDKPVLALMESGEYKVVRYVVIGDINGVPLHLWSGASKHVACWRPITEEAPAE